MSNQEIIELLEWGKETCKKIWDLASVGGLHPENAQVSEIRIKKFEQALDLLKQPKPKLSDIAIPCPDECGGVLEAKGFIDRPICNECGKVFVLCVEPPAPSEFTTIKPEHKWAINFLTSMMYEDQYPKPQQVRVKRVIDIIDRQAAQNKELQIRANNLYREFKVDKIEKLKECLKIKYKEGFINGLREYAWWKNGVQYVGSCGATLKEAIKQALNDKTG